MKIVREAAFAVLVAPVLVAELCAHRLHRALDLLLFLGKGEKRSSNTREKSRFTFANAGS
jgi:hypothetical protein